MKEVAWVSVALFLSASQACAQGVASYYHYPPWVMERIDTKLHEQIAATKAKYWEIQELMKANGDPRAASEPAAWTGHGWNPPVTPTWYIWRHADLAAPYTLHNWPPDAED